jgi:hypothetical protein
MVEHNRKVDIVRFYTKFLKNSMDYCGRGCEANLAYGKSSCIGRISSSVLRPVLSLDNGTFVINSEKEASEAIVSIPPDCSFFK